MDKLSLMTVHPEDIQLDFGEYELSEREKS